MASLAKNFEVTQVRASATLTAATPADSSLVKCRGAKAVHFLVYSTTAGETDAFTAPDIICKVNPDSGANLVITSPAAANAAGILAPNEAACVTAGNQGYVLSVFPDQDGANTVVPGASFLMVDSIGIRINAHATNDISTVVAYAIVET